jgi:hypothetical protein
MSTVSEHEPKGAKNSLLFEMRGEISIYILIATRTLPVNCKVQIFGVHARYANGEAFLTLRILIIFQLYRSISFDCSTSYLYCHL